jgi:HupE / UreJ protein
MKKIRMQKQPILKRIWVVFILCIISPSISAHVVVQELEKMSGTDAALVYLKLGYTHILPLGLDHILFVLSLFLLSPKLKPLLWQATAFTVAHSVTLGLAMYQIIRPPTGVVEPLIAISILYVSLENIFSPRLKTSRIGVVFLFGLIHGMGFAGALGQLGLPPHAYLLSLVMFNAGVELGQVTVILVAWFLLAKWFGDKPWYRSRIIIPASVMIGMLAGFWTIQRILI